MEEGCNLLRSAAGDAPEGRESRRRHSSQRKVKLVLWVHSRDLWNADARRALFKRLHDQKIAGVKIDFLDHEAKDVIDLYHAILRDAAEFQLW